MENISKDDELRPFMQALKQGACQPILLDDVLKKVQSIDNKKQKNKKIMNISILVSLITCVAIHITQQPQGLLSKALYANPAVNEHVKNERSSTASEPVFRQEQMPGVKSIIPLSRPSVYSRIKAGDHDSSRYVKSPDAGPQKPAGYSLPFGLSDIKPQMADVQKPSAKLELPFPVVRLSINELEKIGIYSGSDGIIFEAVKSIGAPFTCYYFPGVSGMGNYSRLFRNYYPVMVSDRYFKRAHMIDNVHEVESSEEMKALTKELIPVIAYANPYPRPLFYHEQIFWFRKTDEIISLMPQNLQEDIRSGLYTWDLQKDSITYTQEIQTMENDLIASLSSVTRDVSVDFDSAQAIHADAALSAKLSFVSGTSYLDYHYKSVKFDYEYHIIGHDTSLMISQSTGPLKHVLSAQKKRKIPLYKFSHPWPLLSSSSVNEVGQNGITYKPYQNFLLQKHKLLPVVITSARNKQTVFWYYPTPNFLNLLDPQQSKTAFSYLENHKHDSILISHLQLGSGAWDQSDGRIKNKHSEDALLFTKLEFDSLTLRKLGILVHDKTISYFFKSDKQFIETNFSKKGTAVLTGKKEDMVYSEKTPLIITDDLGHFPRMSLDAVDMNKIDFNTLVPVYVRSQDNYTNVDKLRQSWRPDVIFWYRPDSVFLGLLPQQISTPMAHDVETIQKKSGQVNCTFFDACKTRTSAISNFRFFPNPVSGSLNIELQTLSEQHVEIQLYDMAGKAVSKVFSFSTSNRALNDYIDLTELPPGIYNLVLQSGDGDKIVSRVIVMH